MLDNKKYLDDSPYSSLQIVPLRLRGVEYLDGVGAPRHVHQGRVVKVALELARVQRSAHNNQLQVSSGMYRET
jgi:hypothetical protein